MSRPARLRLSRGLSAVVLLSALSACGSDSGGEVDDGLAAGGPAASDVAPGAVLLGTLGNDDNPDAFDIGLTDEAGAPVTSLPAGDYTIRVSDPSEIHNWVLSGDGVDDVATDVSGTGEMTFQVTLSAGTYTYVCDPHPSMTGELTVT